MKKTTIARFCIMMFFQFFIWGAWYTSIAIYMGNEGMGNLTHWPYTVNPISAIIAPFIVGLIADRYFATEKVLGILHIIGAIFMFSAPFASDYPLLFILLIFGHCLCYMPTLSLSNSITFHHINDQQSEFPVIRVFGTMGWIIAGLVVSFGLGIFVSNGLKPEQTSLPIFLSALFSLLLGVYAFTLPHTPPKGSNTPVSLKSIFGIDAFKQLGSRSFYIFLMCSLLISIPLAAYFNFTQVFLNDTGFTNLAAVQTIGQFSEIIFMLLMPFFFIRLGVKWMLGVGMFAWVVRYALFAAGATDQVTWMILSGIALHGICYDFFYVTGHIYVDMKSNDKIRGQAQGLLVLLTYGIGMLIGAQLAGISYNNLLGDATSMTLSNWESFWILPAVLAAVVLTIFIIFFKERVVDKSTSTADINI
ncbi:MFS transporter [Rhodohalobacter sulfatireducens]|uniref:MFS transporter n=1 Tax=Rhodohalobacter sulfatireducens TaxID=2911366 RepID=A0ABS9K9G4_9BACT|nr:MFS transporter [Rhodohalobacter sulfatireducens]MCG2587496.1 MFS transporter [Rhodohalobacter sulfatireducens]